MSKNSRRARRRRKKKRRRGRKMRGRRRWWRRRGGEGTGEGIEGGRGDGGGPPPNLKSKCRCPHIQLCFGFLINNHHFINKLGTTNGQTYL